MGRRRAIRARAAGLAAAAWLLGAWAVLGPAPAGADSLELAVKATYLYKLAPFVSWPALATAPPTRRW